jgi:hypothetical protein
MLKEALAFFALTLGAFYGVHHMVYHDEWFQSLSAPVITASFSGILGIAMAGVFVVMMQLFPATNGN